MANEVCQEKPRRERERETFRSEGAAPPRFLVYFFGVCTQHAFLATRFLCEMGDGMGNSRGNEMDRLNYTVLDCIRFCFRFKDG